MAVTEIRRPLLVVPSNNDIEFQASSNQYAVADFTFYITIDIPSFSATYTITPTGSGGVVKFNLYDILHKYTANYYPFAEYGWQYVPDGILDVTVNIGEYYSGAVHSGTDYDFAIFNASLTRAERAVYLPANYQVANTRNNIWLNNLEDQAYTTGRSSCKSTQDMVFYFLNTGTYAVTDVEITTYDSAGDTLGTSYIANSLLVSIPALVNDRYMCINLGPYGLSQIGSGAVTGTYPIISAFVASYRIRFYYRTSLGGSINYSYRYVDIDDCAPKFDKVCLFYLNRKGAWDYAHFYGNHQKTLQSTRTFYKGIYSSFQGSYEDVGVADTTVADPLEISKKTLSSTYEYNQQLSSDWLTDFQLEAMQDMITSPYVFTHASTAYKKYSQLTNNWRFKNVGEKLQRVDINLTEGNTERRQYE